MCPDEILDYYDNYETREYDTTLMLGDVSGWNFVRLLHITINKSQIIMHNF